MDLRGGQTGSFGAGFRFSDLYVWAYRQRFTGGVLVHPGDGDVAVMFRGGAPCSISGPGVRSDHLGELLLAFGDCTSEMLGEALRMQAASNGTRPLIGQILKARFGLLDAPLGVALALQTNRRLSRLFGVSQGPWEAAPGENERLWTVGMAIEAPSLMIRALKWYAPDEELAEVARTLASWSVRLKCTPADARALGGDAEDNRILDLLVVPRRIDTLEAFAGNFRQVRAIVRALMLFEYVDAMPLAAAVPLSEFEYGTPGFDGLKTGDYPMLPVEAMVPLTPVNPAFDQSFATARTPSFTPAPQIPLISSGFSGVYTPSGFTAPTTPRPAGFVPMPAPISPPSLENTRYPSFTPPVSYGVPQDFDMETGDYPQGSLPVGHAMTPLPTPIPKPPPRKSNPALKRPDLEAGKQKAAQRPDVLPHMRVLVTELEKLHDDIESLSAFDLFGVARDAPPEVVKAKHRELLRKFNPDRLTSQLPADLVDKAKDVVASLNQALDVLSDPAKRAEYVQLSDEGGTRPTAPPPAPGDAAAPSSSEDVADKRREAQVRYKMGQVLLQKRDYRQAREHFKFAMEADPYSGPYRASFAWAHFSDPTLEHNARVERAFALVSEAALLTKNDAMLQCYLGTILRAKGHYEQARTALKTALRLQPGHPGATRELRALEAEAPHAAPSVAKKEDPASIKSKMTKLFKR